MSFDGRARFRPGDELHLECESWKFGRQNPGQIRDSSSCGNQNNEPVQIQVGNLLVPRGTAEND